jgi:signal transduction histidine kinase
VNKSFRGSAAAEAEATRTLALLNGQADGLRAELLGLRQDLAQVERHVSAARGAQLLEANEQLVLAALRAQGIADAAKSRLGELARAASPPPAGSVAVPTDQDQQLRDLREANEKLVLAVLSSQALEAQAQEAHRRQIKFLAMVAHELRNPLMPLTLAGRLLDRARLDERLLLKLQATINGQVAHMTRLVGDLLDGSRISTGKFRLERSRVGMRGVLEQAIDTCAAAMETRGQRFTSELPPATLHVYGDAMRLVQVFGNLLDNASKYTPPGGAISLHAAQGAGALVVTVADTGIGISAQALSHVFDLFVQEARATVANRSGLGIGLAVVRELVEAHGGSVVAASRGTDLGSEFFVTLPLADACQTAPAATGD